MIRDWLDIIRSDEPFYAIKAVTENGNIAHQPEPVSMFNSYVGRRGDNAKTMFVNIPNYYMVELHRKPAYLYMSGWKFRDVDSTVKFQKLDHCHKAGLTAVIFTDNNLRGAYYTNDPMNDPIAALSIYRGPTTFLDADGHPPYIQEGMDTDAPPRLKICPHRGDHFPSMVVSSNLSQYYKDGVLHRSGNNPAVSADFIIAEWFQDGNSFRAAGPVQVMVEGYKEFWIHGQYKGFTYRDIHETWKNPDAHVDFAKHMGGTGNPLSNRYFTDIQDEGAWISMGNYD